MNADKFLIEEYLTMARCYINDENVNMKKTDKDNLTELGISYKDALSIIQSLNILHYVSGPEVDLQYKDQYVYVFGYDLDDIELYIKLTFRIKDDLFIMSFHQAKYKMEYPFRK